MRIAYYTSEENREADRCNIREISSAYVLNDNTLVCDNLAFLFSHEAPYELHDLEELLEEYLFREGYLDLRSLELIS